MFLLHEEINPACDWVLSKSAFPLPLKCPLSQGLAFIPESLDGLQCWSSPSISGKLLDYSKRQLPSSYLTRKLDWEDKSVGARAFKRPGRSPGFQPPNRTFSYFSSSQIITKAMISHWTAFSYWIPYLFPSKPPLPFPPSHFFYEPHCPFPQSTGTSFLIKPTLLFLPGILLLQSRLFGESGPLKSSFLAAPGWSRCFVVGSQPMLRLQGTTSPQGAMSGPRASGWHPLSHLPVWKPVGYFRDKDISSHCSLLCFSEFCHHSTSSTQREGMKSAGTWVLIPLQGWALWGAKIVFFPPCVISDSWLLENKVQISSETDDAVFKNKRAVSPLLKCTSSLV